MHPPLPSLSLGERIKGEGVIAFFRLRLLTHSTSLSVPLTLLRMVSLSNHTLSVIEGVNLGQKPV